MKMSIFENIPDEARQIREAVFIDEQGFQSEFDEIDDTAIHIVLYDEDDVPAAACRVFWNEEMKAYTLGRLAVIKKCRGKKIGSAVVKEAERYVQKMGGKEIILHSQCTAVDFYKKLGFMEFGDIEDEQGCPHIWMKKSV